MRYIHIDEVDFHFTSDEWSMAPYVYDVIFEITNATWKWEDDISRLML